MKSFENHELSILKGINFDKNEIKMISFELNEYNKDDIDFFLVKHGYKKEIVIGVDHFYVKN